MFFLIRNTILFFLAARIYVLTALIFCSLFLSSCESDPILSPQNEKEEDLGSYGTSNLRPSEINENQVERFNPQLF